MECPQCHREALATALFCGHCGFQLQLRCPRCQAVGPTGSRFCNKCGAELAPQDPAPKAQPAPVAANLVCPRCHSNNEPGSFFCNSCGGELASAGTAVPAPAPPTEPPAPAPTSALVCPRCHSSNEPGSLYCYRCGYPLKEADRAVASTTSDAAGFWIRASAFLVDSLLLAALGIPLAFSWGRYLEANGTSIASLPFTPGDWVLQVLEAAYFTVLIAVWGTTLGKRLFGLRVVRKDGSRVGPLRALARYLAYFLSFSLFFIGFIMIGLRADKRGLHDLLCDTLVKR